MSDSVQVINGMLIVRVPWKHKQACLALRAQWSAELRAWTLPANPAMARLVADTLGSVLAITDEDFQELLARAPSQGPPDRSHLAESGPPLTKLPPWPHQCIAYNMIVNQTATMLAYDMGTGKSKCIVDAVCNIEARYTLILCPCSVVSVWPREFDKHAAVPVKVMPLVGPIKNRVCWLSTVTSQRVERLVVVLNYEALQHDDMERALRNVPWALMVADESHRIKKPGGIQSRMLARIGQAAKRRVCLTGTPMPHSPLDIYGQYRFLDKSIFGHNFTAFKAQYAVMGGYQNRCAVAFKNQDDLRAKFYSIAHRVEKRDVLDLPKFTHERLDVELSDSARRVYRQLETEFCAQLDKGEVTAANALAKLLRLQQVTSGHVPADGGPIEEVDHGKRDALLSLIDGLADTEPVVVFCRFRHDLDAVAQVCKKLGRTLYELSGRVNELEAWQSGTLGDVLAVQIQSGGVGVDLTRAAYVVYYSLGFSLGDYEQSLARVDRPGQTRPVTYYHLIATKTVDEKVYTALRERKQVVEHILSEGDYGNHRTTTPDGRVRDSRPAAEVAR